MAFDPRLIQRSFALVEENADKVAGHFYALLFLEAPALRDMFPPMMDAQRDRLLSALVRIVHQAHEPESFLEYLRQLGRDHRKFGVRPEHYEPVGRALIIALKRFARPGWTDGMDAAWTEVFHIVADTMIDAAQEAERTTPAWWSGRVVGHERPTESVAVITVQPDHPFPFRPGQYLSVETLRWPRVWRPYSIANAPRADGLLTIHVKAVDGGWVSSALVRQTKVGDVLRMGSAVGGLICEAASNRDVLLVGGGTGIAPLIAMAEDMSRWNTNRAVSVYFGVRRPADLYALAALEALTARCPWLDIVPCVSHDPRYGGERGTLADVLARHGEGRANWTGHDVYLSGSAPMIRATLARLTELEVSSTRIRFDAFGEQTDIYLSLNRLDHTGHQQPPLPDALPKRQASKSSATSSDVGRDWQVNTNPPIFSSGSRA
jgi:ferredoxin-NADP reductase/hemoglobin-like flavoprotein